MMTIRPTRTAVGGALVTAWLLWPAAVQAADPIAIAESFFDEMRSLGATTARHGPISYDPGTRTLIVPDIAIDWPIAMSLGKAGGASVHLAMAAPEVRIVGLREVDGGYRMDTFRSGDGTRVDVKSPTADGNAEIIVEGARYKDLFWPYLPTIQLDPNLPASRYFPYLRWMTQFETGHGAVARLSVAQTNPDNSRQNTAYEGIEINDFRDGRIADSRIRRTVSESFAPPATKSADGAAATPPAGPLVGLEMGPIVYRGYDIGAFTRLIDPESYLLGNTDPTHHPILDEASLSDVRVTSEPGVTTRVGRYAASGMTFRQPRQSIFAFLDRAMLGDEPSEVDAAAFALSLAQSMGMERAAIDDIEVAGPDGTRARIERIALRDLSADGLGAFAIDGIAVSSPGEGDVKLRRFRLAGLAFPAAEAILHMVRIADQGDPPVRAALDVMPMLNSVEISRFAARLKDGVNITLKRYSSEMRDHIAPIPTKWRERIDELVLPVAAFEDEPDLFEFLRALGLDDVELSGELALRWDAATQDFVVDPISLDIGGVADAVFEARIAGVPRLVFEDPENAQAALATLAFTSMRFELRNEKLVQTALATFAEDQGMTPEQARDVLLAQLRGNLATLDNPAFAREVEAAIAAFLENPRRLTITAKPDRPLPATQILGQIGIAPQAVIGLLGIEIEASP